jgi:hypothetical protein
MVCHAQGISPADDGDKQMSKILPTENQDWGFWGTMREHPEPSPTRGGRSPPWLN